MGNIFFKKLLLVLIFISSLNISFGSFLLDCGFYENSCPSGFENVFAGNKYFKDLSENLISSNVAKNSNSNYNEILCCRVNNSNIENVKFEYMEISNSCDGEELLYFTDDTNSRVAISENSLMKSEYNMVFNENHYTHKLCVNLPEEFSSLDILASDVNSFKYAGYSCLFRTNSLINGVVSDCDARYGLGAQINKYDYTIWAKLWENTESLKCNSDCTSVLDNRVYSDCGSKISVCKGIPPACDGSLYGSWVKVSEDVEIKCSAPWDEERVNKFTTNILDVDSKSNCENLVKKKYTVLIDNNQVTMNVYICEKKDI